MKLRTADSTGRVPIGKDNAGTTYELRTDPDTDVVTLTPQLVITPDMVDPELLKDLRARAEAARKHMKNQSS